VCTIVNAHRCCVASPYYEAWMFYVSWLCFPTLFLLGPEGAGHLSPAGSLIGHTFADLLSKNLWGIWSLLLREAVRNHHRKLWKEAGAYTRSRQSST
jgi:bacteriorhodopsin